MLFSFDVPREEQQAAVLRDLSERRPTIEFYPFWDLRAKSAWVLRCERRNTAHRHTAHEIEMLHAAAGCAERMRDGGHFGGVATSVSFATMAERRGRARYLTELHRIEFNVRAPLMLRINEIPDDVTRTHMTEIVRALSAPFVLVIAEAPSIGVLIDAIMTTGAVGFGLSFVGVQDQAHAEQTAEALVRLADAQRAFTFAEDLHSPGLVDVCTRKGIRYGTGAALSEAAVNLDEALPTLPLRA